jgi:hypothetical protein
VGAAERVQGGPDLADEPGRRAGGLEVQPAVVVEVERGRDRGERLLDPLAVDEVTDLLG